MIVEFAVQDEWWSVLPPEFPTTDGMSEEQWFGDFLTIYANAFGEPDGEVRAELARIVADARDRIQPDDAATILFRPLMAPVNSVAHIQLFEVGDADVSVQIEHALIPEVDLALAPIVGSFESDGLGLGTKAAFLAEKRPGDATPLGGLTYAFARDGHVVRVYTEPVNPSILGLMEDPLDEIVRRITLVEGTFDGFEQLGRLPQEDG